MPRDREEKVLECLKEKIMPLSEEYRQIASDPNLNNHERNERLDCVRKLTSEAFFPILDVLINWPLNIGQSDRKKKRRRFYQKLVNKGRILEGFPLPRKHDIQCEFLLGFLERRDLFLEQKFSDEETAYKALRALTCQAFDAAIPSKTELEILGLYEGMLHPSWLNHGDWEDSEGFDKVREKGVWPGENVFDDVRTWLTKDWVDYCVERGKGKALSRDILEQRACAVWRNYLGETILSLVSRFRDQLGCGYDTFWEVVQDGQNFVIERLQRGDYHNARPKYPDWFNVNNGKFPEDELTEREEKAAFTRV